MVHKIERHIYVKCYCLNIEWFLMYFRACIFMLRKYFDTITRNLLILRDFERYFSEQAAFLNLISK